MGQKLVDGAGPSNAIFRAITYQDSAILAEDNGTTDFYKVERGTVMGEVTATGKVRPCGFTTTKANASATTALSCDDASNFYVGDSVNVYTTTGVLGTNEITASGSGDVIDVQSVSKDGLAHTVTLLDPSANSALLWGRSDIDPTTGIETLIISLATDGSGAITSTVQQVIEEINNASHLQQAHIHSGDTGSNTAIAVSSSALSGGYAAGAALASASAVTAVDKTTEVVTISDSIVTVAGDTIQIANGADTARGILRDDYSTFVGVDEDGNAQHGDRDCYVVYRGVVYSANCIGLLSAKQTELETVGIRFE